MKKLILPLSCIVLAIIFHSSLAMALPVDTTVVGGVEAVRGEFPFIVSLQSRGSSHFCGGSLIRKNWVLTAAHCMKGSVDRVVIGLHDRRQTAKTESHRPRQIIVHPNYSRNDQDYDFALIELETSSKFAPIATNSVEFHIPDRHETPFMATVAGWGTLEQGDNDLPFVLQKVAIPLVTREACEAAYPGQISSRMLCAGLVRGGKDSCQGDSGGPLIGKSASGKPILIGVVSWGMGCAQPGFFGIYSKVSAIRDWLKSTIR